MKFMEMEAGIWGVVPFTKKDVSFEKYSSELLAESNIPAILDFGTITKNTLTGLYWQKM